MGSGGDLIYFSDPWRLGKARSESEAYLGRIHGQGDLRHGHSSKCWCCICV